MKLASLYHNYVKKWIKGVSQGIMTKVNGDKEAPKYLFTKYLKKKYTPTLTWEALSESRTIVSADVVTLDSELPLKKRDKIGKAKGGIPKVGMKLYLNEKQLQDIDIMRNTNVEESQVVARIFEDTPRVVGGVMESLEAMFLTGLSRGEVIIDETDDEGKYTGASISANFFIPEENRFGITLNWDNPDSKPIDDLRRIIEFASTKGDVLNYLRLDRQTFDKLRKNNQIKELYAFSLNFVGNNIPNLTRTALPEVLKSELDLTIEVIERTVIFEKNGKRIPFKPWKSGMIVLTPTAEVGSIQWGNVAEKSRPVSGVEYATVEDYILVSKYSTNDPLREYTSSQANVFPVIENGGSTYYLDTTDFEELNASDDETQGGSGTDANITIWEQQLVKADVIAAYNSLEGVANTSNAISDSGLIDKINALNDKHEAQLKTALGIS